MASSGVAPPTRVLLHALTHWPGCEGSVVLLESACMQGWPVGRRRWDITQHWIWTNGPVSAARVGDAGWREGAGGGEILLIIVATAAHSGMGGIWDGGAWRALV